MATKTLFLFLITLLISPAIFESNEVKAQEKLILSTLHMTGLGTIAINILQEAYEPLGIELEIEENPAERSLMLSNSGMVDGELIRVPVIERNYKNLIRVNVPIYSVYFVGFVKRPDISIQDWSSLPRYKIGTVIGYKYVEIRTKRMNRDLQPHHNNVLLMLNEGRIDIAILSLFDGLIAIKNLKLQTIRALKPPLHTAPMFHYLHKKHQHLVPEITNSLLQIEQEGRIEYWQNQMYEKLQIDKSLWN